MTLTDLHNLHNKIVLVKSARDRRNPPTAIRGTIEVHDDPARRGSPLVRIALDYPQMFRTRAQHHTLTLDSAMLERLLASERNGTFELTVEDTLEAEPVDVR
jgi:hypothetical protein